MLRNDVNMNNMTVSLSDICVSVTPSEATETIRHDPDDDDVT